MDLQISQNASERAIRGILASEFGEAVMAQSSSPFDVLGVDSFDLLAARAAVEQRLGRAIDDRQWSLLATPQDIVEICASPIVAGETGRPTDIYRVSREWTIGMPQMAVGGLSEAWLFRELGDMHWHLVMKALETRSSALIDGAGDRLYATFTRFKLDLSHPLRDFGEDEPLFISGSATRYGAGIVLGSFEGHSRGRTLRAELMSSFSKRGNASNKELLKGQPTFPANCAVPEITQKPELMTQYGCRRRSPLCQSRYSTNYRIDPYRDINGVGLLYFATYPVISDSCELACLSEGAGWAMRSSTLSRDICYFANSDADEELVYHIRSVRDSGREIEIEADLSRRSDSVLMASFITRKAL